MKTLKISQHLLTDEGDTVEKRKSLRSVTVITASCFLCFATGIALATGTWETKNFVFFILLFVAIGSLISGLYQIFFGHEVYVYVPTESRIQENSLYCSEGKGLEVINAIEQANWTKLKQLIVAHESPVKLELITSKDFKFAKYQLSTAVEKNFEPLVKLSSLDAERALEIVKLDEETVSE